MNHSSGNSHLKNARLAALILALGGLAGGALADPAEVSETTAAGDPPGAAMLASAASPLRLAHRPLLVASDCVKLEQRRSGLHETVPVLANRCDYPVTVAYCVDDAGAKAIACQAAGQRRFEVHHIQAGAQLGIDAASSALFDSEVDWVACRGNAGVISALHQVGGETRGECLGPDSKLASDLRTAAVPDSQR